MATPATTRPKPKPQIQAIRRAPSPAPAPTQDTPARAAARVLPVRQDRPPSINLKGLTDADVLLALDAEALERLHYEASIRLGTAKRRRAALLMASPIDSAAVGEVNGEIGYLGPLLHVLTARRGALRIRRRVELGRVPERCEAIAQAVDSLLNKQLHRRIQAEADRILKRAAADLTTTPASEQL